MTNTIWAGAWVWKTKLTANDSVAQEQLWSIRREYDSTNWVRVFKYVDIQADTTVANWTVLYHLPSATDATRTILTSDESDWDINMVAWVWIWAITAEYYGWVQLSWYHSAVITNGDDDIAQNDAIIWGWDGTCNSVAANTAPTNKVLGWAVAADSDTWDTVAANLVLAWDV